MRAENRIGMGGILLVAVLFCAVIFLVCLLNSGDASGTEILTTKVIRDNETGGDCEQIGTWNADAKTCTLTTDVTLDSVTNIHGIEIQDRYITLDGNGHTVRGPCTVDSFGIHCPPGPDSGPGYGVWVNERDITVKNLTVERFEYGISLPYATGGSFEGNTLSENSAGFRLKNGDTNAFSGNTLEENGIGVDNDGSSGNAFSGNTFSLNHTGIYFSSGSDHNTVYQNDFLDNTNQAADDGSNNDFYKELPDGGNYWTDYDTHAEGCDNVDFDGYCDSPYIIGGSAGNMDEWPRATESGWFDEGLPIVNNVTPSGWINSDSPNIEADFHDRGYGDSGVDGDPVVRLDSSARSGCTAAAGHVSCPTSGLDEGEHLIEVIVTDNGGNVGTGSGSFSVDTAGPNVTDVQPSGSIKVDAVPVNETITVAISDPGSGIDWSTFNVTLNGNPVSCTHTSASASCPAAGLTYGDYAIGGSVSDNAGNLSPISGSFTVEENVSSTCSGEKPPLSLSRTAIYWGSHANFETRKLSVDFDIDSFFDVYMVEITGASTSTPGVYLLTETPLAVGDITGGGSASFTLQYNVPEGVLAFNTTIYGTAEDNCGNSFDYPV